jgi:hypothetical protein
VAGFTDALGAVMMHANLGDSENVIVGGEFKKRDFKIVGEFGARGSWEEVKKQFQAAAERIQKQVVARGDPAIPSHFFDSPTDDVEMVSLTPD